MRYRRASAYLGGVVAIFIGCISVAALVGTDNVASVKKLYAEQTRYDDRVVLARRLADCDGVLLFGPEVRDIARTTGLLLQQQHYSQKGFNDEVSSKFLDRYAQLRESAAQEWREMARELVNSNDNSGADASSLRLLGHGIRKLYRR